MKTKLRAVASVLVTLSLLTGCSPIHEPELSGIIDRGTDPAVAAQVAYARDHYKTPNKDEFGDLGGTDCVNFTSQTLLARGWKMTDGWAASKGDGGFEYTRAWISSTGFRDYLAGHPELATAVSWEHNNLVLPGDVVQFDWDGSGDRDHTAIVSGIEEDATTGKRTILVSSHSPGAFDWPITDVLAEQDSRTQVYFWRITSPTP
jgi:hypothetical protein